MTMTEFFASHSIQAKDIEDAWYRGLDHIMKCGNDVIDERKTLTREVLNLMISIKNVDDFIIPRGYPWTKTALNNYLNQFMNPNRGEFSYTYGERFLNWNNSVNQISEIIKRLRNNSVTRRATASTLIPSIDSSKSEIPCLILCDFKIREGRLHLSAVFRSHDFADAYPANLLALSVLLKQIAFATQTRPETITTHSISAHVYEYNFDYIKYVLSRYAADIDSGDNTFRESRSASDRLTERYIC